MIDQDRLETARTVLLKLVNSTDIDGSLLMSSMNVENCARNLSARAVCVADELHDRLERTQKLDTGHPAETALEQLLSLIADHHDKLLPKWIAANARHRKLGELVSYLGADIETP